MTDVHKTAIKSLHRAKNRKSKSTWVKKLFLGFAVVVIGTILSSVFFLLWIVKELPDLSEHLSGHTAIVVGGDDPSGVAKALGEFLKETKKVTVKAGTLGDRVLNTDQVKQLANLPSLEVLQSQLLSLFSTPATQLVSILSAPARSMVTVLQAKADNS